MKTVNTNSFRPFLILFFLLTILFVIYSLYNLECNNKAPVRKFEASNSRMTNTIIDEEKIILETLRGTAQRFKQDDPRLISYVKEKLLVPPNNKPYKLGNAFKRNTSQSKQNLLALNLLINKTNGFFIECGAWNGEFLSNSLLLERDYGWTGLLIEASRDAYKDLTLRNRKSWISNTCLSTQPYPKIMNFYIDDSGIASLLNSSDSMKKYYNYDPKNSYEVQCIPLYTFLVALNVNVVDYLSLDVEGADFDVLKTIPFDKVIFKVLEVETNWVNEGKPAVRTFLESKGYIFVTEIWPDYIFIHSSLAKARALNLQN